MTGYIVRDSIETVVAALWTKFLGHQPSSDDASFFGDGGTSLSAARFAVALGDAFDVPVPLTVVFQGRTVRGLSEILREDSLHDHPRSYVLGDGGDGAVAVLIPGASGDLAGLQNFGDSCFERTIYGLDARGFSPRGRAPALTVSEAVDDYVEVMERLPIPHSVHLLGHCLGGIYAYELGRALLARGWQVLDVTLVSTSLPTSAVSHQEAVAARVRQIAGFNGIVEPSDPPTTVQELYETLRAHGVELIDREFDAYAARIYVYAAIVHATGHYEPTPLDLPVTLINPPDRVVESAFGDPRGRDWRTVGIPQLDVVDIAVEHDLIPFDRETLLTIEAALKKTDPTDVLQGLDGR